MSASANALADSLRFPLLMTISSNQIADALIAEHRDYLINCSDDDGDMTLDEYIDFINTLSYDELVAETSTDDSFTLTEYVNHYSN